MSELPASSAAPLEDDEEIDDSIDSLIREAASIPRIAEEPDRIGTRLGRYRIDAELGRGGMGIVFEAEDVELARRVALKVLPQEATRDDERRRRFLREARAAAKVSHPNLAAMFDVGEESGTVFLAMELVRGGSLRERIAAAPKGMPVAKALHIAKEIARGLGKAHASGVVHRDLKPENVMMEAEDKAKIVDFGLAKLAASTQETREGAPDLSTQDGKILGTPSYMAPEQAKGSRVGPQADVFSLGVLLYEMLTGERPFAGASMVDILVAVARDAPPRPSKRAAGISREVDAIVLRCLAKDPEARFADGDAVAAALEACVAAPKKPPALALAAGALALLGLGLLAARSMHNTSTPPAVADPAAMAPASPTPSAASAASNSPSANGTSSPALAAASASMGASVSGSEPGPSTIVVAPSTSRPASIAASPASSRPTAGSPPSATTVRGSTEPRASVDPLARQK